MWILICIMLLPLTCYADQRGCNLSGISTTGMSEKTAKGNGYNERGVEASRRAAQEDLIKVRYLRDNLEKAERETGVVKHLLAGIASRESRAGRILPKSGYGFDGHGFGIMQVDDRSHRICGEADSYQNVLQGAQILKDSLERVARKHPNWSKEDQLKGGIAAYNFDVKNVQTTSGIDRGTTGDDYSSDVIARAQYFEENGL